MGYLAVVGVRGCCVNLRNIDLQDTDAFCKHLTFRVHLNLLHFSFVHVNMLRRRSNLHLDGRKRWRYLLPEAGKLRVQILQ